MRHALLIARLGKQQLTSRDGRLAIVRLLGYGASGVVCEGYDHKLGRKVALKLYPGRAQDALARAVRTEAQTLAALSHNNIVVVHDFDADEFRPGEIRCFLVVMELLSGTTLRHWMAEPHPASEVLDVFCRAGDGLAAAHARGIVHRDFKPENVMLDGKGEPKLVDFGLAILDSPAAGQLDSRNPEQRAIVGTLAYMAPEALRGHADARSDQFSFAAALWEALSGEFPYPIDDLDPSKRVVAASPRSATRAPPALFDCLRRALDADPVRRFPKMIDLVARLRELHGELRSAASVTSAPTALANINLSSDTLQSAATTSAAVVPSRSWAWIAFPGVGVGAIVAVLAAAGFWTSGAPSAVADDPEPVEPTPVDSPPPASPAPSTSSAPSPGAEPPIVASPPPFSCPVDAVKGEWLFKDSGDLYSLELARSPAQKCELRATFKTVRDEPVSNTMILKEFPPLLGAAVGKFNYDGAAYVFFFTFEDGKLRGHVDIKGSKSRSSLILGGRDDSDRKPSVSSDQPCAALCIHCNGLRALERCRAQCAGARDGSPGCPAKRP